MHTKKTSNILRHILALSLIVGLLVPSLVLPTPAQAGTYTVTDDFSATYHLDTANSRAAVSSSVLQRNTAITYGDMTSKISAIFGSTPVSGIAYDSTDNYLFVAGGTYCSGGQFVKINLNTGATTDLLSKIGGSGCGHGGTADYVNSIQWDSTNNLVYVWTQGSFYKYDVVGDTGTLVETSEFGANGFTYDSANSKVYYVHNPNPYNNPHIYSYSPGAGLVDEYSTTTQIASLEYNPNDQTIWFSVSDPNASPANFLHLVYNFNPSGSAITLKVASTHNTWNPKFFFDSNASITYWVAGNIAVPSFYSWNGSTETPITHVGSYIANGSSAYPRVYDAFSRMAYISTYDWGTNFKIEQYGPSGNASLTDIESGLDTAWGLGSNLASTTAIGSDYNGTIYYGSNAGKLASSTVPGYTQVGQSSTLATVAGGIQSATLTKSDTPGYGSATYYLSNDGGATWQVATPGSKVTFARSGGKQLKYKVSLSGNATVSNISISYTSSPKLIGSAAGGVPPSNNKSIIHFVGFESGDLAEVDNRAGSTVQSTTVKDGSYALETSASGAASASVWVSGINQYGSPDGGYNYPGTETGAYYGFWFRYHTKPASGHEPLFGIGTYYYWNRLDLDSSGHLLYYGDNSTLMNTSTTVLAPDTWYFLETKFLTVGSVATYEVRINGTPEYSGTFTYDNHGTGLGLVYLGKEALLNAGSQSVDYFYDDLYVSTQGYVTNAMKAKVAYLKPNGNGTLNGFGGSANNYQSIQENPSDSFTSYITWAASGADNYEATFQPMPQASTILGLKLITAIGDGGGPLSLGIRSGNSFQKTATTTMGCCFIPRLQILSTTSPATHAPWTRQEIAKAQVGVYVDASSASAQHLSTLTPMVYYIPPINTVLATPAGGGLVGKWTFDKGDNMSKNVRDTSGRGNNGYLFGGATTTVSGKVNQGLSFNGSSQYVTGSLSPTVGTTNTFCAWVKFNSFVSNSPLLDIVVGDTTFGGWINAYNDGGGWKNSIYGSGFSVGSSLVVGKWYYVCNTRDGTNSNGYISYLNGVVDIVTTRPTAPEDLTGFTIGAFSSNFWSNATIDDVRIYNRVLTPTEVKKNYTAGFVGKTILR